MSEFFLSFFSWSVAKMLFLSVSLSVYGDWRGLYTAGGQRGLYTAGDWRGLYTGTGGDCIRGLEGIVYGGWRLHCMVYESTRFLFSSSVVSTLFTQWFGSAVFYPDPDSTWNQTFIR